LLAQGDALNPRLHTLLAQQDRAAFDPWLQEAETSDLPSFQIVVRSVRQDYAAMIAAPTTPWSTGQGVGQICRVKLLKRLGYGRTKLDLLGQRILHHTDVPMTFVRHKRQGQHKTAA
jgi:transposase